MDNIRIGDTVIIKTEDYIFQGTVSGVNPIFDRIRGTLFQIDLTNASWAHLGGKKPPMLCASFIVYFYPEDKIEAVHTV